MRQLKLAVRFADELSDHERSVIWLVQVSLFSVGSARASLPSYLATS